MFDDTLYTTSLKILLKYLKRKRGLTCKKINTLEENEKYTRYVVICKDKEKNIIRIEAIEMKKKG